MNRLFSRETRRQPFVQPCRRSPLLAKSISADCSSKNFVCYQTMADNTLTQRDNGLTALSQACNFNIADSGAPGPSGPKPEVTVTPNSDVSSGAGPAKPGTPSTGDTAAIIQAILDRQKQLQDLAAQNNPNNNPTQQNAEPPKTQDDGIPVTVWALIGGLVVILLLLGLAVIARRRNQAQE